MLIQEVFSFIHKTIGSKRSFRLAMGPLGKAAMYCLGITRKPVVRFVTRYGFSMETSGYEYYMSGYMFLGETNPEETFVLRALLRNGDTMIDIGAHIGWFALNAAQRIGNTGKVVAFEPNPHCLKSLRQNVHLNDFLNIAVEACAVSDTNGTSTFWIGDDMAGSLVASNTQRLTNESIRGLKVRLQTLDSCSKTHDMRRLTVIKIDVEGAELRVLKGAHRLLKRLKPHLIIEIQEDSLHAAGSSREEVFAFLSSFGYKPFLFRAGGLSPVTFKKIPMDVVNVLFSCDAGVAKRIA